MTEPPAPSTFQAASGAASATGRLAGRVALITGASRGIGRAVALRFAREGADVILLARTVAALEEVDDEIRAEGGAATLVPAELTDYPVIERMSAAVYERWGRLDVLVGNAGMLGVLSPLSHISPEVWDQVLAVNVTANWRLIRSFDPLLRASPAGRLIFVTSAVASGRAYWGAHAVSKGALETMVRTYAAEVAKTPVRANLINPGPTRTSMRAQAYPGEDPASVKPPEAVTDTFVDLAEAACSRHGEIVNA
jgi:NAD(P)-dependent dehydrogenase (short-subunit alcohol dehydrogenase family)